MDDMIQQLKAMKHSQQAGAVDAVRQTAARAEMLEAIGGQSSAALVSDYFAYYREVFTKAVSVPVTVIASFFVLVFGGWMTTVNAASNSLPGDTLYTVKILTERAQLQFASGERRAVLHTEFAQRRFQEVVALTDNPARTDDAEDALNAFREQLAAANSELHLLQEEGDSDALMAAAGVDQVLEGLEAAIEDTDSQTEAVLATAMDATRETSQVIEDVTVEVHEADPQEESEESIGQLFRDRLEGIRDREAFNYGRIVVLSQAAEEGLILQSDLATLNFLVESTASGIHDAMSLAAVGGYRTAFDILREVDDGLIAIESQIVELEAIVIAGRQEAVEELEVVEEPEEIEVFEVIEVLEVEPLEKEKDNSSAEESVDLEE
jgi:hypothetical protein